MKYSNKTFYLLYKESHQVSLVVSQNGNYFSKSYIKHSELKDNKNSCCSSNVHNFIGYFYHSKFFFNKIKFQWDQCQVLKLNRRYNQQNKWLLEGEEAVSKYLDFQ